MGQDASTMRSAVAERHAARGWPAFLTGRLMQMQAHKFRVRRSVLGRRVRLLDRTGGCIEYARLAVPGTSTTYYQRVDGPCSGRGSVPKFPLALAPHELPGGEAMPYRVGVGRPNYAEVVDHRDGRCATYRRSAATAAWIKVAETCRETAHDAEVARQVGRAEGVA